MAICPRHPQPASYPLNSSVAKKGILPVPHLGSVFQQLSWIQLFRRNDKRYHVASEGAGPSWTLRCLSLERGAGGLRSLVTCKRMGILSITILRVGLYRLHQSRFMHLVPYLTGTFKLLFLSGIPHPPYRLGTKPREFTWMS